jgi:hypothetical protein
MATESGPMIGERTPGTMDVPAPTPWPMVLAFGICLLFAGLATSAWVSVLGAAAALVGTVGWCRQVLPRESLESVPTLGKAPAVTTRRREVARLDVAVAAQRAWLPLEIYPISAGIKGGLAGCVAMAVLAILYGVLSGHGIWYPINLLSAGFFPRAATENAAELGVFRLSAFVIAAVIHVTASLLVGLLYGAMLPIVPRRPVLLGGLLAPLIWTGFLHSILEIIDPVLNQRVDWFWFVLSQVGFGIVAGIVVSRQHRVNTLQGVPLAIRVGIEAPGIGKPRGEEGKNEN